LVDAAALEAALRGGALAGAGLDVYPEEPYAGPLCERDNVVLTPHVATLTRETRAQMETEAVRNLLEELAC
ncbi:MAG: NAD(P)-dependent oxidoreductase, partial [Phycisphaerae bacterium]